jgi:outer membrane protein OmpA-like peptidoglycan-associated protein
MVARRTDWALIRLMRHATAPFAALAALIAYAAPAEAQMYPGEDVTVSPAGAGMQVLLYPGGQYGRLVHPLLQPGQQSGPIHLRMPLAKRHAAVEPVARQEPPKAHHKAAASAAPVQQPQREAVSPQGTGSTLNDFENLETLGAAKPAEPAPQRVAKTESPPAHTPERPERKAQTSDYGSKRDTVLFASDASNPSDSAIDAVKSLAAELSGPLSDGSLKVQLYAYGGERGDKSSDSRRLSLKRAIVVRQLLIDNGVPSDRIDVHAMGGVDDNGPADRVDIFLKS